VREAFPPRCAALDFVGVSTSWEFPSGDGFTAAQGYNPWKNISALPFAFLRALIRALIRVIRGSDGSPADPVLVILAIPIEANNPNA